VAVLAGASSLERRLRTPGWHTTRSGLTGSGPAETAAGGHSRRYCGREVRPGEAPTRVRAQPVPVLPALPYLLRSRPRQRLCQARQAVAEGRSSAMSLITASIVRTLRTGRRPRRQARKLLAFVDNARTRHSRPGTSTTSCSHPAARRTDQHSRSTRRPDDEIVASGHPGTRLTWPTSPATPRRRPARRGIARAARGHGYRLYLDLERGWR